MRVCLCVFVYVLACILGYILYRHPLFSNHGTSNTNLRNSAGSAHTHTHAKASKGNFQKIQKKTYTSSFLQCLSLQMGSAYNPVCSAGINQAIFAGLQSTGTRPLKVTATQSLTAKQWRYQSEYLMNVDEQVYVYRHNCMTSP